MSASVHGTLLWRVENSAIKLLGYCFLQAADENDEDIENLSLLTLTGDIRYYLNSSLHLGVGLGLTISATGTIRATITRMSLDSTVG